MTGIVSQDGEKRLVLVSGRAHPELAADALLLDPTTRALAADPSLERVRQLGRSLDPLESSP